MKQCTLHLTVIVILTCSLLSLPHRGLLPLFLSLSAPLSPPLLPPSSAPPILSLSLPLSLSLFQVLVESWVHGQPVVEYFSTVKHDDGWQVEDEGKDGQDVNPTRRAEAAAKAAAKKEMAFRVFDIIMKMFLRDNNIHADLHGGNMIVSHEALKGSEKAVSLLTDARASEAAAASAAGLSAEQRGTLVEDEREWVARGGDERRHREEKRDEMHSGGTVGTVCDVYGVEGRLYVRSCTWV